MNARVDWERNPGNRKKTLRSQFGLTLVAAAVIAGVLGAALRPAVASGSAPVQLPAQTGVSAGPDAVVAWNAIALRASTVAQQNAAQSQMYLAQVQAAVYNAVIVVEGGYQLYNSKQAPRPGASVDAAVAAAAHAVLVRLFPDQQAGLDGDYDAALAAIPAGPAKDAGVEAGREAAVRLIAMRQDDGLEADIGFTMPTPAPGVWQLRLDSGPISPWISEYRPFMLASPDQFRPSPPPDLTSRVWARQFEEMLKMGRKDSPYRTAEQTDIALFWSINAIAQFNQAFQKIVQERGLDAVEAARLYAMGNLTGADALIACFDAKYHYLYWRPQFAIPLGGDDGNTATTGDPTWRPLLDTPNHPEYPSAHSCLTSAMAEVFAAFLGTQRIEVDLASSPNLMQPVRHYEYAQDMVQEVIDSRVWGGIHYRVSAVTGAALGRTVARWSLRRYFLPMP